MPAPKIDDEAIPIEEKRPPQSNGSSLKDDSSNDAQHDEQAKRNASIAVLLKNPLVGMSDAQVLADADDFVESKGLQSSREAFRKGALMARVGQRKNGFESLDILSGEEKAWLRLEETNRWKQPFMLYFLVVLCAGSAIVQGMDQTAVKYVLPLREVDRLLTRLPAAHSNSILKNLASQTSGNKGC